MKDSRSAFKILTGTPAGKSPLRRPKRRWEGNVRMDLKEIGIKVHLHQPSIVCEHCLQTFANKKRGWCIHSPAPNRVCEPCSSVPLLVGKLANAQRDSVFVERPV